MMPLARLFSLESEVAIVTGAGRGIGRACALALAEAGADVALAARTGVDLEAVAQQIRALGRRAIVMLCDVNDENMLDELVARTIRELGKITLLVNNAGGTGPNDPLQMSGVAFADALVWNIIPAYSMIQKCVPHMNSAGGGAVVNISSVAARDAQKQFSAYGSAKAAMSQMTRNLAQDFAPSVRINAIAPAAILTPTLAQFLTPERRERMVAGTPLGRLGQPEDIGAAAVFLCSAAAAWITGKVLEVDGGAETPYF